MTGQRRQRLHTFAAIAVVVMGHAGLIAALALAGEWRVWRLIVNVVAQLYALAGIGWIGWDVFPSHGLAARIFAASWQPPISHRTVRQRDA